MHHPVLQGHLLPGEEFWILAPLIPQLTRRIAAGVCGALLILLRDEGTAALCSQKPSPTNVGSQLLKFLDFTVITCCVCPSKTTFDETKVGPDSLSIRYARTGGSLPRVLLLPHHLFSLVPALPCLGNQASSCIPHPSASLGRGWHSRDAVLPHRAHERCSSGPGPSINPAPSSSCPQSSPAWLWLCSINSPHCLNRNTRSKSL